MLKKISDISTSFSSMAAGKWTPNEKGSKKSYAKALFGF